MQRLTDLVDTMQDEASNTVGQLPLVTPVPRSEADIAESVIHRIIAMGVFEAGRATTDRVEPGGGRVRGCE